MEIQVYWYFELTKEWNWLSEGQLGQDQGQRSISNMIGLQDLFTLKAVSDDNTEKSRFSLIRAK